MKSVINKICVFLILMITTISVATPTHWQPLSKGLDYAKIELLSRFHLGRIHAFRIDLDLFSLELAIAADDLNTIASVKSLAEKNNAVLGINGGFFSQELKPLGLRVADNQVLIPLKSTPWWNVFFVRNKKASIVGQKEYRQKNINFAIQSGPRLIAHGKIPNLKPGTANRSALGITKTGKVILLATENLTLTTTQLANIMHKPEIDGGLECIDAINLDGGSSTQLFVKTKNFYLNVPGLSAVTDAILVIPRESS